MAEKLNLSLQIDDPQLRRQVSELLGGLAGVALVDEGETPHVIVRHCLAVADDTLQWIRATRQSRPETEIFVISPDKDPDNIVAVMKAGAAEFFPNRMNPEKFRAAIEQTLAKLAGARETKGALYSFVSAKGGLGATVVAVNTAAALARVEQGREVALLDMSLQSGDSSVYLDTIPATTITDLCRNYHRLDFSFLKGAMLKHGAGLHYLAAPKSPEDCKDVHGEEIRKILHLIRNIYPRVVIDCTSMQVDECAFEAFNASDKIFILIDMSVPAIRNASRLAMLLGKLKIPPHKIEFVVNRFIKGKISLVEEIEKNLKKRIFWFFPNDFDAVISSINSGSPLVKVNAGAPVAKSVVEFAGKLAKPDPRDSYRGIRGFLGKTI